MILLLSNHRENHRYFETLVRHLDKNAKVIKDKSWSFIDISAFIFFKRLRYDDIYKYWLKERIAETQKAANSIQAFCFLLSLRLNYAKNIYRLKKHRPKTVVLWNGLKPQRAIMVAAAAELQINCVFMENGLLPNTTVFDQKGVNALNSMPRDAAFYQALPSRSYTPKKLVVREAKRNKISSEKSLPVKYIFIPFQVDSDSQIVMFSPWIRNMSELFQLGLELQQQVPEYKVVFKEHPSSGVNYDDLHTKIAKNQGLFANTMSTETLIESADIVLTINSTVGIEALNLGKPVITLGEACYNIDGLTYHADSFDQLVHIVRTAQSQSLNDQLRLNFLSYLEHDYLIAGSWKEASETHLATVKRRLEALP